MDNTKGKKRWPLTLVIIATVVIVSAAMIYSFRDAPGRLPASAISDGSGGVIMVAVLGKGGLSGDMVYAQRLGTDGNHLWGDGIRIDR